MRPVLVQVGQHYVASYSAMMFLGVLAGVFAAIFRIRGGRLDGALLAKGMIAAVVVGWLSGRIGLWLDGTARDAGLRILSPMYPAPGSLTYFLVGVVAGLLLFAAVVGKESMAYFDALAPSTFPAIGFAKIGCLMAGCCAGGLCPPALGIQYPYGSPEYEHQYRTGALTVPAELLRPGEHKDDFLFWGHAQSLSLQPELLADRIEAAGLPRGAAAAIIEIARGERSRPVWPTPAATSAAAFALWIAAEMVFRKSRRPGATLAFVFVTYGVLRLTLDWTVAQRGPLHLGMTTAQWVGVCAVVLGAGISVRMGRAAAPAD